MLEGDLSSAEGDIKLCSWDERCDGRSKATQAKMNFTGDKARENTDDIIFTSAIFTLHHLSIHTKSTHAYYYIFHH